VIQGAAERDAEFDEKTREQIREKMARFVPPFEPLSRGSTNVNRMESGASRGQMVT
jgi:hypothetical protein